MRPWPPENPVFAADFFQSLFEVLTEADSSACLLLDFPLLDYQAIHSLQLHIVELKKEHKSLPDVLLAGEHAPVFTQGNRGNCGNLLVTLKFLEEQKIEVVQTKRGGDITYHGPGQIVFYPILSLSRLGLSLGRYIYQLEEIMLRTLKDYGVEAARNNSGHGIWIKNKKTGSVGIAVRHGIAYHGLALNVTVDLTPFSWINPCGLTEIKMQSLGGEINTALDLEIVKQTMLFHYQKVLQTKLQPLKLPAT